MYELCNCLYYRYKIQNCVRANTHHNLFFTDWWNIHETTNFALSSCNWCTWKNSGNVFVSDKIGTDTVTSHFTFEHTVS